MSARMTAQEVLSLLGGQQCVRDYLRGIDEESETDRDARRAMLGAIHSMRAGGIHDVMAEVAPELYAQAALMLCRMWTDAEDGVAEKIVTQYQSLCLQLRYDEHNEEDDNA